jgi:hypothetical protein
MLKLWFDRGEKKVADDRAMAVSAVVFKPTAYKQFVRPWNRMLRAWNATAFHATDFYTGYEEFVRDTPERKMLFEQDSRRLPSLIAPHLTQALAVAFRPDEVMPLLSDRWKQSFGDSLHSLAVQMALFAIGEWAKERKYFGGFAVFIEDGDPDSAEVETAVKNMSRDAIVATSPRLE